MKKLMAALSQGLGARFVAYLAVAGGLVAVIGATLDHMPQGQPPVQAVETEHDQPADPVSPLGPVATSQPKLDPYRAPSITVGELQTVPPLTSSTVPLTATTSGASSTATDPEPTGSVTTEPTTTTTVKPPHTATITASTVRGRTVRIP